MPPLNADFVMSTELELLTATPTDPAQQGLALEELLQEIPALVPTLPGPVGLFCPYGRVYPDCAHVELSLCEVHCPYVLPLILERLQGVVAAARNRLAKRGIDLLLANNNHSGLLHRGCAVWGSHENHLVEVHPSCPSLTRLILPYLVTRFYAGAGGIEFPSGDFLAAVRPICMTEVTAGGTTSARAIHSTARDEHHMGAAPQRYRLHGILGDGHMSQLNTSLVFGATALALKAIIFDRQLPEDLARLGAFADGDWLGALRRLNVLQTPGGELRVDPVITQVQRIYLNAARRYADRLRDVPAWIPRLLNDWDAALTAVERLDRSWLSARLDSFIKYEFYSSVLSCAGLSWADLPSHPEFFHELALLDHSYHNFCDPDSVFCLLERQGLLEHRVGPSVPAGAEAEPFVPECATRAAVRARFIKEHAGQNQYLVDWSQIWDRQEYRVAPLEDPFATGLEFVPVAAPPGGTIDPPQLRSLEQARRSLRQLREFLGHSDETPI